VSGRRVAAPLKIMAAATDRLDYLLAVTPACVVGYVLSWVRRGKPGQQVPILVTR
jgi:hypothetical protein